MAGAGELLRRARESRRGAPQARERRANAPRAEHAAPRAELAVRREAAEQMPAVRRPELQPHHGAYSALMRSHDRMRTQHLPVQGGGGRA